MIPINYHIGCMGLAPASHEFVDSIPPMVTGGNLDNKGIGVGTTMYYPVEVAGALLSMGDAHAAQGDSELDGTGIETSINGRFKITVIKAADFNGWQSELDFPLAETETHWVVHGFTETDYLKTFAENPRDIYGASSIDKAMKNAFTQTRKFLMAGWGMTDMEATTIITQGVDFGVTQGKIGRLAVVVHDAKMERKILLSLNQLSLSFSRPLAVDGNWGVHGLVPKAILEEAAMDMGTGDDDEDIGDSATAIMIPYLMSIVGAFVAVFA